MRSVVGWVCGGAAVLSAGCFASPESIDAEGTTTTGVSSTTQEALTTLGDTTLLPPEGTSSGSTSADTAVLESSSSSGGDSTTGAPLNEANYVFVTSQSRMVASFGGIEGADAFCQELADIERLPGEYVAWISGPKTDAIGRLEGSRGWIRPDGRPVADLREDLVNQRMLHSIEIDERGEFLSAVVTTATADVGTGVAAGFCENWTAPTGDVRIGNTAATNVRWSSATNRPCSDLQHLYCFGVGLNAPLNVPPAMGRLAFVSRSMFTGDAGVDAFDQACQLEGEAERPGMTFKAFVARGGAAAVDRFDLNGPPWVNARGVLIRDTAEELNLFTRLIAPVFFHADAEAPGSHNTWTGTRTPTGTAENCGDWTNPDDSGVRGLSASTELWLDNVIAPCDAEARVLCFEE